MYDLNGIHHNSLNGSNHISPGSLGQLSGQKVTAAAAAAPSRTTTAMPRPTYGSKHESSRAIMMNTQQHEASYLSPVPHRSSVRKNLIGFDPLLSDATAGVTPARRGVTATVAVTAAGTGTGTPEAGAMHNRRISAPMARMSLPFAYRASPTTSPPQSLTPPLKSVTQPKKKHRRGVQSFCMSDLRPISQKAMEPQPPQPPSPQAENRSNPNTREESPSPSDQRRTPPPLPKPPQKEMTSPKRKSSIMPISMKHKESASPAQSPKPEKKKKEGHLSLTPPRSRKLPWPKKGHRRSQSLETNVVLPTAQQMALLQIASVDNNPRLSLHNTPTTTTTTTMDRNSTSYSSFVQDLKDLSFDKLQLPSLAKPMPTSFLVGKEDEVVRTCEREAAPFQMEIPTLPECVVAARLNEFVDHYRRLDQHFDLQTLVGSSRMDLRQVKISQHVPIAQALLQCGDDVCLQGVVSKGGTNADDRLEAVVFEGQRQFVCVFRATTEQQSKPGNSKFKKKVVPLDAEQTSVELYQCFLEEYHKLEQDCFALLDKLTEEHPFCDVVFTGHSAGAAMATLAAFRYATARPTMRVNCLPMASPKVGFSKFRQMVNSLPNLKVMRLEFGQDAKCQLPSPGGSHVGHTLVLHGSLGHNSLKASHPVLAYQFDTPKLKTFKTIHPDLRAYVTALEELARLNLPWAKDFVGTGMGVVVNNEARQMV
jgi:hypothetical protein